MAQNAFTAILVPDQNQGFPVRYCNPVFLEPSRILVTLEAFTRGDAELQLLKQMFERQHVSAAGQDHRPLCDWAPSPQASDSVIMKQLHDALITAAL